MKAAELKAFGPAPQVVDCVEAEDLAAPTAGQVVIEVLAAPVNPADLLLIEGKYANRPPLPAPVGIEGAGRVLAVGAEVTGLAPGDLVMSLHRANWAQRLRLPAEQLVKAPADLDPRQLAMLKVNPATAYLMLKSYRDLAPGDWLVQNAANSAVGNNVIRLAKAWGLRTVNIVRREAAVAPLQAIGADVVLLDGPDVGERARRATGGEPIRLAIDAVAGPATRRLADCLDDDGIVVNYGLLSGAPCELAAEQAIFRGITLTGFWLAKVMRHRPFAELQGMYRELMAGLAEGRLGAPIEAVYPLAEIKAALAHAGRAGRDGKVLLLPNGTID